MVIPARLAVFVWLNGISVRSLSVTLSLITVFRTFYRIWSAAADPFCNRIECNEIPRKVWHASWLRTSRRRNIRYMHSSHIKLLGKPALKTNVVVWAQVLWKKKTGKWTKWREQSAPPSHLRREWNGFSLGIAWISGRMSIAPWWLFSIAICTGKDDNGRLFSKRAHGQNIIASKVF